MKQRLFHQQEVLHARKVHSEAAVLIQEILSEMKRKHAVCVTRVTETEMDSNETDEC